MLATQPCSHSRLGTYCMVAIDHTMLSSACGGKEPKCSRCAAPWKALIHCGEGLALICARAVTEEERACGREAGGSEASESLRGNSYTRHTSELGSATKLHGASQKPFPHITGTVLKF